MNAQQKNKCMQSRQTKTNVVNMQETGEVHAVTSKWLDKLHPNGNGLTAPVGEAELAVLNSSLHIPRSAIFTHLAYSIVCIIESSKPIVP